MDALLQNPFPVGVAVIAMAVIVLALLTVTVWLNQRAPTVATPTVIISFFMMMTFVVVVVFSTLRALPESKASELLLGALISTFTVIVTYWFSRNDRPPD